MVLSLFAGVGVGGAAYLTALLGPGMFSSDLGVQAVARTVAPIFFCSGSNHSGDCRGWSHDGLT